jgi:putative membrane protein
MNHFREDYRKNVRYFAVFLLGIAAGAVVFSSVILYLLGNHSLPTMLFFIGLLLGIVPFVALEARGPERKVAPREVALAALSLVALFALSRIAPAAIEDPADTVSAMNVALVLYVLFAGILNGATLVIPGLSGAFLLLIMGLYPLVIYSISSIGVYISNPGNFPLLWDICLVMLPFGIGGVAGCLGMARLMEKLMRDFHRSVYAVILGLTLGSVVTLLQDPIVYQSGTSAASIAAGAAAFCAGFATAFILGKRGEKPG